MKNNRYLFFTFLALMLSPNITYTMDGIRRALPPASSWTPSPYNNDQWGDIPYMSETPRDERDAEYMRLNQHTPMPTLPELIHLCMTVVLSDPQEAFDATLQSLISGTDPNTALDKDSKTPLSLIFEKWKPLGENNTTNRHQKKYKLAELLLCYGAQQDNICIYITDEELKLIKQKQDAYKKILLNDLMEHASLPSELASMTGDYSDKYLYSNIDYLPSTDYPPSQEKDSRDN